MVALGAVLVPATARANFSSPTFLSDTYQNAEEPQVAISGSGVGLAVWERYDGAHFRVQARTRASNGSLGAVQTLSDAGQDAFSPQVAVNATGTGIISWTRNDGAKDRIQAVTRSSSGVLGPVLTLSDPNQNAESSQVAIDPNGNAIVVWERSDGTTQRIQAVKISPAGTAGPVLTLTGAGGDAFSAQVAMDPNGNAQVVWSKFNLFQHCDKVQAVTVSANGTVGATQALSEAPRDAEVPQVGIDANGKAVVVWQRFDGANDRIQGRTRSLAGTLGPINDLSVATLNAFAPQVAVNSSGGGLVVWSRSGPCGCDRVQMVPFSSAGTVGTALTVSDKGQFDEEPQVGIAANGSGVAIWESFKGAQLRVQARTRTASGALGSLQGVSSSGLSFSPQVAMSGTGSALAVWTRTGAFDRIQASAGP